MNHQPLPVFRLKTAAAAVLVLAMSVGRTAAQNKGAAAAGKRDTRVAAFFERSRSRADLGGTVQIATDGKLRFDIAVPPDASPVVRFAADELTRYLHGMTGAKPRRTTKPSGKPLIILGDSEQARKAGIQVGKLARDGYRIIVKPDQILIAGNDDKTEKGNILFEALGKTTNSTELTSDIAWDFERGTLNGTYRFLEACGCRWFMPGPLGEMVPTVPNLSLEASDIAEEPAFALRVFGRTRWRPSAQRHVPVQDLVRPEIDAVAMNGVANRMWLVRMRASSEWFAFNHRPPRTFWEQRFADEHPEYFAVLPNGKRDIAKASGRRHTGHLCYSQEGVFRETVKDIDAFFSGKTAQSRGIPERYTKGFEANNGWRPNACYGDTVSLLPHDGFRGCHCARCLAKTAADGPAWETHSNLVWPFVARTAQQIDAMHPDKLIICLAYSSYSVIPADLDLPNNVIVGVCPRKLNKIYNIIDDGSHAELFDLIERLSKANDMPLLFWFHHLYRLGMRQATYYGVPMLLPHFFGRFLPELAAYGRLFFCEMDHDSILFEHLNRYVVMRLLFSPETNVEALLEDYLQHFFGPGGRYLGPVIQDIEKHSEFIAATAARPDVIWRTRYTEQTLEQYWNALEKARKATRNTAFERQVDLFGTYFLGLIQKGRDRFLSQFADPKKLEAATILAPNVKQPVSLDGKFHEQAWNAATPYPLLNNINAKPISWASNVKVILNDRRIACAFDCRDPRLKDKNQTPPTSDYIEIFLEPPGKSSPYYQILIYTDGRVLDFRCPAENRDADKTWVSHAQSAVSVRNGAWTMEVTIPVDTMVQADSDAQGTTWRANFCRTIMDPPQPNDQFSSTSPFMRGAFRQPHMFVPLTFR